MTFGIDSTGLASHQGGTANVATNGGLTLQVGFKFGTSNGGNSAVLNSCKFTKVSSALFS